MTVTLSPSLSRAARGLLGWSMLDLARAAGVSLSTTKRFESGNQPAVSDGAIEAMRAGLEAAGIRFLPDQGDGPGLRFRPGCRGRP